MKFELASQDLTTIKSDCLVVPVNPSHPNSQFKKLDKHCNQALSTALKNDNLGKSCGQTLLLTHIDNLKSPRVLLVNTGNNKKLSVTQFASCLNGAYKALKSLSITDAVLAFDALEIAKHDKSWGVEQAVVQLSACAYRFEAYKSKKSTTTLDSITFAVGSASIKKLQKALQNGISLATGIKVTKDIGNTPGNVATPKYIAQQAKALSKQHPSIKTKVFGEADLKKMKMGALLAVGQGSNQETQFIEITYKGSKRNSAPIVLVGKGVSFDAGGISLKPGPGMEDMKMDMLGAASVLGIITAIAHMKLPLNVTGLIASAENMPDGNSYKPGDVITGMSGKTIEIVNTDAEGRLCLSDALTYAQQKLKPELIIDMATLTGAMVVALGTINSGLFCEDEKLTKQLLNAAKTSEDCTWHMPLNAEYQKGIDSKIADMKNAGPRWGGAITAACFLQRFIDEGQTWAHLDIAGSAMHMNNALGTTGRPVPLMVQFLRDKCQR